MDNITKIKELYSSSEQFRKQGNIFLADQMEKVADHLGRILIKEAVHCSKKMHKKAVIEKPERSSTPHSGLRKKGSSYSKEANLRNAWNWAAQNPLLSRMGQGAALTAGGLTVAAPVAYIAGREVVEDATDTTMDKIKEYAVPGALAVAGLAAGAYGLGKKNNRNPNMAPRRPVPRRKVAELIAGFRTREKLAKISGENSDQVVACEKAISRLLFGA